MKIIPDNEAYLIKAPLMIDEAHQLDFANENAQRTYFQSLPKIAFMKITYNRENGTLYFNRNIEEIRAYNYLMYRNTNYGNKWFYAFITDMKYENNTTTAIQFSTDVFQTYMFDYTWKNSFVERETVSDDTRGTHLLAENLEYGDYVVCGFENYTVATNESNTTTCRICMMTSEKIGDLTTPAGEVVNSIPQGAYTYIFDARTGLTDFNFVKGWLDSIGKGSAILSLSLVPQFATGSQSNTLDLYNKEGNPSGTTVSVGTLYDKYGVYNIYERTVTIPTTIDGYVPKNNKCFCAPYNYFYITNNAGQGREFYYEDFYSAPYFEVIGAFSMNGEYAILPINSKKSQTDPNATFTSTLGWSEIIKGTPLPMLAWESDYYLNWCASNNPRLEYEMKDASSGAIANVIQTGISGAMSNGPIAGAVGATFAGIGGAIDVSNLIEQQQMQRSEADRVPNSIRGAYGIGDLAFSAKKSGFSLYKMCVRREFIERIDDYFSKFGYRVNEHKIPNLTSRTNWNYIKTVGANLIPNGVPQEALQELKSIFNNGVTIWHNPTNFLNYSASNTIIS